MGNRPGYMLVINIMIFIKKSTTWCAVQALSWKAQHRKNSWAEQVFYFINYHNNRVHVSTYSPTWIWRSNYKPKYLNKECPYLQECRTQLWQFQQESTKWNSAPFRIQFYSALLNVCLQGIYVHTYIVDSLITKNYEHTRQKFWWHH